MPWRKSCQSFLDTKKIEVISFFLSSGCVPRHPREYRPKDILPKVRIVLQRKLNSENVVCSITKQKELQKHLAESLEVQPDNLKLSYENESTSNKSLKKKCKDFDNLMSLVKAKMKTYSHAQIIQLLTLVPVSWTHDEIIEELAVTNYMIRCSRKILNEKGILSISESKKGRELSQDVLATVKNFYCSDEYSRMMPGKKDFVSVSINEHMQKKD